MKKSMISTVLTGTILFAASASANVQKDAEQALEKVGNAWTQCGIGAMIFKDLPVAAAISNVIWDLGTTAVISMTASPDTCKGVRVAAATFINESLESIEQDLAEGNGEHLATLFGLMGIEGDVHFAARDEIRETLASSETYFTLTRTEKAQYLYVLSEQYSA